MSDKTPPAVNPLEQALVEILQKTVNALEAGVDFLSAQIPDVIPQLLMWHALKSGIVFGLGVIGMIFAVVLFNKALVAFKKAKTYDNEGPGFGMFLSVIGGIICFLIAYNHLDWLQILVAPKLYLIEYAAELYKGMK